MGRTTLSGVVLALALSGATATVAEAENASLRGSRASMELQNRVAKDHGLSFHRTPAGIRAGVAAGELVELPGNADYAVADFVSYPYLQPAAKLFVERLSAEYRAACDQKLVVTSAVRPSNGQPRNAHALSVHPAGMAVDLRVSDRAACREWLEDALLEMETRGVLNGIREQRPPHYHVAIFPEQYLAYAAERQAEQDAVAVAVAKHEEALLTLVAAEAAVAAAESLPAPQPRSGLPLIATIALLVAVPIGRRALDRRRVPRSSPDRRRAQRQ
ncbi:hypothetical protein BH23GEM9_BH23GEM9_12540 [soil metagenome]